MVDKDVSYYCNVPWWEYFDLVNIVREGVYVWILKIDNVFLFSTHQWDGLSNLSFYNYLTGESLVLIYIYIQRRWYIVACCWTLYTSRILYPSKMDFRRKYNHLQYNIIICVYISDFMKLNTPDCETLVTILLTKSWHRTKIALYH